MKINTNLIRYSLRLLSLFWIGIITSISCTYAQDTLIIHPSFDQRNILTQLYYGQNPEIQLRLDNLHSIDSWTITEDDKPVGRIVLLKTLDEGYFWKVWYHDSLFRIKPCCEPYDRLLALEEIIEYKIITESKQTFLVSLQDKDCLGLFFLSENAKSGIPFQLQKIQPCENENQWYFISPKPELSFDIQPIIKFLFAYIALNSSTFRQRNKLMLQDK